MKQKYILAIAILLCLCITETEKVFATMSSPNYTVQSDVIGSFGGDAASTNFSVNGTGGESIVGSATGTNTNGNLGYWQTNPVVAILPSATFTVDVVNDFFVKISGVATYPGTVTIQMQGNDANGSVNQTYGPISVNADGTYSFKTDALNEGTYVFSAVITDTNGSTAAIVSGTDTATITLGAIEDYSITVDAQGNAVVSGKGFPNSEVKIKIYDAQGNVIDTITDTTDGDGNFSKTISGLAPGDYTIKAAMVDGAGEVGPYDASKDITIPGPSGNEITTFTVNKSGLYKATVAGTAQYPGTITIHMTGTDGQGNAVSQTFGPIDVQSDGSFIFSTDSLNVGHYIFSVTSSTGQSLVPNGDNFVDIVLGKPDNVLALVRADAKVSVSGEGFPLGSVEIIIRDSNGVVVYEGVVSVDAQGDFSLVTPRSLPVGTYILTATLLDAQGNKSNTSEVKTVIISEALTGMAGIDTIQNPLELQNTLIEEGMLTKNIRIAKTATATVAEKIAQAIKYSPGMLASIVAATAAAAAITPVVLGTAALNSIVPSFYRFLDFLARTFFGFFGGKRRKAWGVVYDGSNGKPLSTAVVSLYNVAKGNVIETRITDKYGSYYFYVLPGEYEIKVKKDGYVIPESLEHASLKAFYKDMYLSGSLIITEEDVIHKDIPMVSNEQTKRSFAHILLKVLRRCLALSLFYGGFILSVYMLYREQSLINIALVTFYVFMLMMRNLYVGEPKPGRALNVMRKPLPFVWIKILNKATGEREARVITDENGKYFMVLNEGEYVIDASSVDNALHATQNLRFTIRKPLDSDIILHAS